MSDSNNAGEFIRLFAAHAQARCPVICPSLYIKFATAPPQTTIFRRRGRAGNQLHCFWRIQCCDWSCHMTAVLCVWEPGCPGLMVHEHVFCGCVAVSPTQWVGIGQAFHLSNTPMYSTHCTPHRQEIQSHLTHSVLSTKPTKRVQNWPGAAGPQRTGVRHTRLKRVCCEVVPN